MTPALLITVGLAFAPGKVLTLGDALSTAVKDQPSLHQARAQFEAAGHRADEARSGLLPQITGTAAYRRSTQNNAPNQVSAVPGLCGPSTFSSCNNFNFGLTLNQLVFDFGQTIYRWRAAQASAEAQGDNERTTRLLVTQQVRTAFFAARAQKSLVQVATETLSNQRRHLDQIEGFVKVGARPEIDLAQSRTDVANARVQLITTQSNYETAKAQLNQTMGVEGPTDYDVGDESMPPIAEEGRPLSELVPAALQARPDAASFERQLAAQELNIKSAFGAYFPSLGVAASLTEAGIALDNLAWNASVGATLTWPLFQGLLTRATVAEQRSNLEIIEAQRDTLRQQIRLEVDTDRLAVRSAIEALGASDEALTNARERLRLAEGRYRTGVGNIIELGDAQLALTAASGQRVQAEYNLSSARAALWKALGRE